MLNRPCELVASTSFLSLLLSCSVSVSALPVPVVDSLVEFDLGLEPDVMTCRGVRLSENLIATAPTCVEKARSFSNHRLIEVRTIQDEPIGVIAESTERVSQESMMLDVTLDMEQEDTVGYPEISDPALTSVQLFAYNVDEQRKLIQQPVVFVSGQAQDKWRFFVASETRLPIGSPVFDDFGRVVCFLAEGGQCYALRNSARELVKRGLTDDDYDDDGLSTAEVAGILAGVLVAASSTMTGLFYLISFLKAHSKGMPANVFWPGILSLQYCSHCTGETAIPAVIGTVLCPFGTIAPLVGCPISAYLAVSRWVDHYAETSSEHTPIITQQP